MDDNKKESDIQMEPLAGDESVTDGDLGATPVDMSREDGTDVEIEIPTEELIARLEEELAETRRVADENLDGWQRSLADFANYKKRTEREQAQVYQQAAGRIIRRYLEISDDLQRALKNPPVDGDGATWARGIELISQKLHGFLAAEGVEPMDAVGQPFDPNLHEAIAQEENDQFESGQIIEVVQTGYTLGDRVLRPAIVRVAK